VNLPNEVPAVVVLEPSGVPASVGETLSALERPVRRRDGSFAVVRRSVVVRNVAVFEEVPAVAGVGRVRVEDSFHHPALGELPVDPLAAVVVLGPGDDACGPSFDLADGEVAILHRPDGTLAVRAGGFDRFVERPADDVAAAVVVEMEVRLVDAFLSDVGPIQREVRLVRPDLLVGDRYLAGTVTLAHDATPVVVLVLEIRCRPPGCRHGGEASRLGPGVLLGPAVREADRPQSVVGVVLVLDRSAGVILDRDDATVVVLYRRLLASWVGDDHAAVAILELDGVAVAVLDGQQAAPRGRRFEPLNATVRAAELPRFPVPAAGNENRVQQVVGKPFLVAGVERIPLPETVVVDDLAVGLSQLPRIRPREPPAEVAAGVGDGAPIATTERRRDAAASRQRQVRRRHDQLAAVAEHARADLTCVAGRRWSELGGFLLKRPVVGIGGRRSQNRNRGDTERDAFQERPSVERR